MLNIPLLMKGFSVILNGFEFITNRILSFVLQWKYSYIRVASPGIIIIAAFIIVMIAISREKPLWVKHRKALVYVCSIVIAANIIFPYTGLNGKYRVSFIDVGQAECTLIVTPKNKTIMIDAGTSYGTTGTAEYTIVPYLLKHGNTKIDYLMISHAHSDHMGEVLSVISEVTVKNIIYYYPDIEEKDPFEEIKREASEKNINLINMYYNRDITVDNTTYINRVCDYFSEKDVNEQSLVVAVRCGNNNLIFAGDMTADGIEEINFDENVLIYKAAHHGSKSSISDKIAEIAPKYTVIFTKAGNIYRLPNDEAIEFYSEFTDLFLTQEYGEITFEFSDENVKIYKYFDSIKNNN